MDFDGFFFEGKRLFLQDHLVVLQVGGRQLGRALGFDQGSAEVGVDLRHVESGRRSDFRDFVIHEGPECRQGLIHSLLLFLQVLFERLGEFDLVEALVEILRKYQCGARCQVPGAVGAVRTGGLVGRDDLPQLLAVRRRVVRRSWISAMLKRVSTAVSMGSGNCST